MLKIESNIIPRTGDYIDIKGAIVEIGVMVYNYELKTIAVNVASVK